MKTVRYKFKKVLRRALFLSGYYSSSFKKRNPCPPYDETWERRIKDVLLCEDNKDIPRVKNAGQIINNKQIMHNGLQIKYGSYYGSYLSTMLRVNKGVHEPQEEKVFGEVLKYIPEGSVMIELGSYWSFYSMWFSSKVVNAKCYMIEPDIIAYCYGKSNFRLNGMKGDFTNAFISSHSSIDEKGERITNLDDFVKEKQISQIAILHSDIQGYEYEMLKGATQCFEKNMIHYLFISTHSSVIHQDCLNFLLKYNFQVIAAADLPQTYSVDGLIAARAPFIPQPDRIPISLRSN